MPHLIKIFGEKMVAKIEFRQSFPIFGRHPEVYTIHFVEGYFYRRLIVEGSDTLKLQGLHKGTEVWTHLVLPWREMAITNDQLLNAIEYLKRVISTTETHRIDNVIQKPTDFWRRD